VSGTARIISLPNHFAHPLFLIFPCGYRYTVTADPLAPLLDLADVAPAMTAARERTDAALRHRA
jgi:hypothetical protein